MLTYSVAIRTLATHKDTLRKVITSVFDQTVVPEKVIVYLGEGHEAPDFRVATECYVTVPKGMFRQRALEYSEITSDCILMLDDDILMHPDTVSRLLQGIESGGYDLLGVDVHRNHLFPASMKLRIALANLVFPHQRIRRGFMIRPDGSFSYPLRPDKAILPSDTCAGSLMMWRSDSFRRLHINDETWLEDIGFPYAEDAVMSYKAVANGMKVGVDFGADVTNLDCRSASSIYHADPKKHYIRSKAMAMAWWRMNYRPDGHASSVKALAFGLFKALWLSGVTVGLSAATLSPSPFTSTLRGIRDGLREACKLDSRPYIFKN